MYRTKESWYQCCILPPKHIMEICSQKKVIRTTRKEKVLKENNNKESEDENKEDNVGTEKKECDCSEKEKYIPTYVPLTESYYFPPSALYVPHYSVLVP
ncbi:hypothetical protein PFFCH_02246 [Plasmodium falciparum FCH/4]|uniref:Uncharacterized protein n=1 Tax=Plasmodium falciparum FCH/4 TaxID=1036724 RepID=A0A024VPW1_PLAFA|nr:hypothetical protein PFFCH_02246 [Plasmodium falciparum FCH/4]